MYWSQNTSTNIISCQKASICNFGLFVSKIGTSVWAFICLLLLLQLLLVSPSATAAVKNLSVSVSMDGVAPFDADNEAGNDSSANNKIIRTQDTFEYLVSYDAVDTNEVNFTLTLPAGVFWHSSSTASSVCNGTVSGGGFLDSTGRVLTCFRKPSSIARESFYVRALPGAIKNGEVFSATIKASDETVLSEPLTVSATPKIDLWMVYNNHTKIVNGGTLGVLYTANFEFGAYENALGNLKGIESVGSVQTFVLEVGPGGVPYNCTICSQPGGPGTPITITKTINNSFVRVNGNLVGSPGYIGQAQFRGLGLSSVQIFTPLDPYHPIGTTSPLIAKSTLWDPLSLSGVSNYGSGYATGYDPSYTCPTTGSYINAQRSCMRYLVDRTQSVKLMGSYHGVISGTVDERLFGDNSDLTNANSIGSESVVPGQTFRAMFGIYNDYTAETPATNAGACIAWDPALFNLTAIPTLKFKAQSGGNFYGVPHLSYANLASSKYVMEFAAQSFTSDSQRKDFDCGKAGNAASGWFTNPNSVPGGITAVSHIRYRYLDALDVNDLVGIVIPFVRPTTASSIALGAGNPMPWFEQYYSDQTPLFKSNYSGSGLNITGGRVNSIDSFFRHTATLGASSLAPGGSTSLTMTPVIVGPVGEGINTTTNSAKITITMPNTCLEPLISSLPTNAVYTAGNWGTDGVPCTLDAGESPSKVVINFGTLTATGGAVGPAPYQGHASFLSPVTIFVVARPNATLQSLNFSSVASAFNDISPPDGTYSKTVNHSLTISGVASFSVDKTVSGVVSNKVSPNQVFTYSINFSNAGTVATGKGRFVDLLPFDGDSRGTTGLGASKLQVVALNAAMSSLSQGSVVIEYTQDAAPTVEAALLLSQNEDARTGVNWTTYAGGAIPNGITAVRFTTSGNINQGFSGYGSIQVKAPDIVSSSKVVNNVWGRTEMIGSDVNTVKVQRGASTVTIQGLDGASLKGKVYLDSNENKQADLNEAPIQGAVIGLKCASGACLNAAQGTDFSLLTDSNGEYSFEPNGSQFIYQNLTATGTVLTKFQGLVAGVWTLTLTPPSNKTYLSVSSNVGKINSIASGTAGTRTITNITIENSSLGVNYNFGEKLEPGKITVTKELSLPAGVSSGLNFVYTATCDKPNANTQYTATLSNYPTNKSVDILNIPAGASCVMSETLPTVPNGYLWQSSTFSALSPSGTMPAAGVQTTTASNSMVLGVSISKQVIGSPERIDGTNDEFYLKYKIEVTNSTAQAVTYSLSDIYSFESDLTLSQVSSVTKSANVSSSLNASFNGSSSAKMLVSNEALAAGSVASPTVESYELTLRVRVTGLNKSNNICNSTASMGAFGQASLSVSGVEISATACIDTPAPLGGKITVQNNMTLPSDVSETFNISYKAICDLPSAGTIYSATLKNAPSNNSVDILHIPAGASCTLTQTLPLPPSGYVWKTETIGVLSPDVMPIGGDQTVLVSNSVSNGLLLLQSIDAPVSVSGSSDLFDVTYHLTVSNSTPSAISYSLDHVLEYDPDVEIQGVISVGKSSNVASAINPTFDGKSVTKLVTIEKIDAATAGSGQPSLETYDVKLRVKVKGFTESNNSCSGSATGLFASANLLAGSLTRNAAACSSTPNLADGKIVITHLFSYPNGVSGPFTFTYKALCNKPQVNTEYSVQLQHTGSSSKIEIPAVPAGATCVLSQDLPAAPAGFLWKTGSIGQLSPVGAMPAGGEQKVTISNELQSGVSVTNELLKTPVLVAGSSNEFDLSYLIQVSNSTNSAITYSLNHLFGFDNNAQVIGTVEVIKSNNVTQSIVSGFNGSSANSLIVSAQSIDAAFNNTPTVHTFTVQVRVRLSSLDSQNKACTFSPGKGLFSNAILSFSTISQEAAACSPTPTITPVYFKIKVNWVGGKPGDTITIPATSGFKSANTLPFKVSNSSPKKSGAQKILSKSNSNAVVLAGESAEIALAPLESGTLPEPVFDTSSDSSNYLVSPYVCTDGTLTPQIVAPLSSITLPLEAAGKVYVCSITNTFIEASTTLMVDPPSGTAVEVGRKLSFTLETKIAGAATLKPIVLSHQLDKGLTMEQVPMGCSLDQLLLKCTLATNTSVGTHSFSFSTIVNDLALQNSPRGVTTTLSVDNGECSNCQTNHGMWEVEYAKTSDAAGKKGVQIGSSIRYTVSVWVKGSATTEVVHITDTRSVGLSVQSVPENCSQKALVIQCFLPKGSAVGRHDFIYDAIVTKEAKDIVSNTVKADQGVCKNNCSTEVKVIREVMLRVTKTALNKRVKIGDFVRYEVLIENLTGPDANDFYLLDHAAPGLTFVPESLRLIGDKDWHLEQTIPIKISKLDLAQNEKITISYLMRVHAGAGRGELINQAWVEHAQQYVTSNRATASVLRTLDPDFEETHINGIVFLDQNLNGLQDENEKGIAGVRIAMATGALVETDGYGRYHFKAIDPGYSLRGRNVIVKIDESSLPDQSIFTTQNPLVKRVSAGIPAQFNFGVKINK